MSEILFWSKGPEEFRFLSNFYECPVTDGDQTYKTAEHAYQCAKTTFGVDWQKIKEAKTPAQAKKLGGEVQAPKNWDSIKESVMLRIIRCKFHLNEDLKKMLIMTDGHELVHFAPWGDQYWGVDKKMNGLNMQGKILMRVRDELLTFDPLDVISTHARPKSSVEADLQNLMGNNLRAK